MGKLKRTTEDVAEYFKAQGCELLDEYHGCMEPMDYKCSCGEYGTTTWNNFTKGKRCGQCTKHGQSKKRSLKQVQEIFKKRGCEFLDSEFKGIHYKHCYRCKCGEVNEITFAGFHHQNQLCKECGRKKNMGSKHHGWRPDREKKREDDLFRKKCYKALSASLKAVGKKKVGRTSDMLGYGPKELQEHITQHPNWTKVKDQDWHLDHIFPVHAFLERDITDVALINHLDNLQPLTQTANNQKHSKYNKKEFEKWLKTVK
jgi:hypothetical protein